jgi:hypothetical protein
MRRHNQQAVEMCRQIAKDHGFKLRAFTRKSRIGAGGEADLRGDAVVLFNVGKLKPEDIVSTFFHEMAHILCKRNRKYASYHGVHGARRWARATIFHGLTAERYVDNLGRKLCKQYLPTIKWEKSYQGINVWFWYKTEYVAHAYRYLNARGGLNGTKRQVGDRAGR